jgi:hypothetical protein
MGSFHMHLFGVVYVTCGNFYDGSEKGTAKPKLFLTYKKTTKHNEIQEKAQRVQTGMCTEQKLHSN